MSYFIQGEKSIKLIGAFFNGKSSYKESRIKIATENFNLSKKVLKIGDWNGFIKVLEDEANQLHGMMMMSHPSFYLLESNSVNLIKNLRQWRNSENIRAGYTIDAEAKYTYFVSSR